MNVHGADWNCTVAQATRSEASAGVGEPRVRTLAFLALTV